MPAATIAIPHGAYWCSPFARWQGALAEFHSLRLAAWVTCRALAERGLEPGLFEHGVLGLTVPQRHCFYGLPWVGSQIGAPALTGPTIMQACATSARVLVQAAQELQDGHAECVLALTADRTSNGPHLYYPAPAGAGGTGESEDWVLGNFDRDPALGIAMVATAENCARRWGVSRDEQHAVALQRYEQYLAALVPGADGRCFQDRYMVRPLELPDRRFERGRGHLEGDEGVRETTAAGLARLRPVVEGGSVTHGAQTHPADGNAGMVLSTPERARELARDPAVGIRLLAWGQSRTESGYMPAAPVEAARRALAAAGIGFADLAAVKSHNPFAVNDILFARETGIALERMNNFGCSLVWGHPQAPTGMRAVIELVEELAQRGGGHGLFHGCAAGDSAMALVVSVT